MRTVPLLLSPNPPVVRPRGLRGGCFLRGDVGGEQGPLFLARSSKLAFGGHVDEYEPKLLDQLRISLVERRTEDG